MIFLKSFRAVLLLLLTTATTSVLAQITLTMSRFPGRPSDRVSWFRTIENVRSGECLVATQRQNRDFNEILATNLQPRDIIVSWASTRRQGGTAGCSGPIVNVDVGRPGNYSLFNSWYYRYSGVMVVQYTPNLGEYRTRLRDALGADRYAVQAMARARWDVPDSSAMRSGPWRGSRLGAAVGPAEDWPPGLPGEPGGPA
ncbi:MAG: hypothetical protein M1825_002481 [Sarcosagium campestre]|nr:MAG: hypothetical protein M1825_002481 [Sarcosagium campestre]